MSKERADRKHKLKQAVKATADDNGRLTPEGVVSAARDKNSVLHGEFEWDDRKAGHAHRLDRARELIREVTYVAFDVTERVVQHVQYVHDPRERQQSYIPLHSAVTNRRLATEIVAAEVKQCVAHLDRALDIAGTLKVTTQMYDIRSGLETVLRELGDDRKRKTKQTLRVASSRAATVRRARDKTKK